MIMNLLLLLHLRALLSDLTQRVSQHILMMMMRSCARRVHFSVFLVPCAHCELASSFCFGLLHNLCLYFIYPGQTYMQMNRYIHRAIKERIKAAAPSEHTCYACGGRTSPWQTETRERKQSVARERARHERQTILLHSAQMTIVSKNKSPWFTLASSLDPCWSSRLQ